MLLQYFGFREEPFGATPDPRCLFQSGTHREALASLRYGFQSNRGFTAMIAPPGTGKTTLLFRFLEDIQDTARTVFLFDIDAECEPQEFILYILRDIGVVPGSGSSEMHEQLSSALAKEARAGRKLVIVIDEAQNLSDAVLERVRLLSNFETSHGKLMQIVLSGQPQLSDKLAQASLLQLRQRISTICRIDPLSEEETVAYIDYRLKQAGYDGEPLFTEDALKLIAEASQGIPRTINCLCFNAMSLCCAMNRRQVESGMVAEVLEDLQLIQRSGESCASAGDFANQGSEEPEDEGFSLQPSHRWIFAAAGLALLSLAGIARARRTRSPVFHRTDDEPFSAHEGVHASALSPDPAGVGQTRVPASDPDNEQYEIAVQPEQRLQDISVHY